MAALIMLASFQLANGLGRLLIHLNNGNAPGKASPFSGVSIAILVGILVNHTFRLPGIFASGIQFSITKILRLGIIFVGIKLSLLEIVKLGIWGLPIVLAAILSGLVFVTWFNRLLGLPERLGTLIAVGTGICGITAIVATAPAIEAEKEEVAYAVANITLFGLLGMLFYPYLAHHLFKTSEEIGLFLGTAIHDTSQVIGAALAYKEIFHNDVVLKAATVTKLTRNLFLAGVVPAMAYLYLRNSGKGESKPEVNFKLARFVPLFVLGFLAAALVRSIGDISLQKGLAFGIWSESTWKFLTTQIGEVWGSHYLLGTALAAVGLNIRFAMFKGIGLKPFAVGFAGALFVGAVGLIMALLLGRFVPL